MIVRAALFYMLQMQNKVISAFGFHKPARQK